MCAIRGGAFLCVWEAADACLFRLTADDTDSDGGCGRFLLPGLLYTVRAVCRICPHSTAKDQLSHVLHISRGDNEFSHHTFVTSRDLAIAS